MIIIVILIIMIMIMIIIYSTCFPPLALLGLVSFMVQV